jgi:hypothetical protein
VASLSEQMTTYGPGHNKPPSLFDFAREIMGAMSDWMKERPAIGTEDEAREAKLLLDRARNCAADIEAERVRLVTPLNEKIDAINAEYKAIHNKDAKKPGLLDKVVSQLKIRLAEFIKNEEDRREAEAALLRQQAAEAEAIARAAEQAEQEAIANARAGELGVDVTQVVVEADSRFADFERANREAARADRATHVKVGGGFGNAASLRTKETLILVNYGKALKAIGPNDKIREAILSAARDYRKEKGTLPDGVEAQYTRAL